MISIKDLKRFLAPIQRKLFLLVGRAVLKAIDNSDTTQRLQMTALFGETITGVERFQEYGLESHPWEEAQAAVVFPDGNRDGGIVVCVFDRRYRPLDLVQGEVALYTDEDKTTPFRVQMKRGRILFARAQDFDFDVDGNKTEDIGGSETQTIIAKKTVTVPTEEHQNSTEFGVVSPQIKLGSLTWAALRTMVDSRFIALFNAHVHSDCTTGPNDSGAPTTTMIEGSHCTNQTRAI